MRGPASGVMALLLVACTAAQPARRAEPAPEPAPAAHPVAPEPAAPRLAVVPTAEPVAPPSRSTAGLPAPGVAPDASPWPDATPRILLTWVVYPATDRRRPGEVVLPVRRIELVARAGAVARRFSTEVSGSIFYATLMQRRCREPGAWGTRVAELYMNGGGNAVLGVDRHGDELVLVEEGSSDGLCEPSPCPVSTRRIASFVVPHGAAIEERFHVVEGAGAEHDESCPAP